MNGHSFIEIGFGNLINVDRTIAIVGPDSSPIRRIVQDAKDRGAVIDASSGRKTRAVIIMDSEQIVMSALTPEELEQKMREAVSEQ
ncbi:MAG TPA: DUF370 domain-containing protein [Clostridiaceae bacterium]|nr:DUF370 domain-containing protein [Clostridiaceae bacterium]